MVFKEFESFIGKDISFADYILVEGFDNTLFGDNFFYTKSDDYEYFYGMLYSTISLVTDERNIVNEITIHFEAVIDNHFYDSFIVNYGEPNIIQVVSQVEIISEGENEDESFSQYLRKGFIETREGTFEEGPLFIFWNKENYQIKILLRHESGKSQITFRVPKEGF